MSAIQVFCPNCEAVISAADMNLEALLGKCGQCDHLFSLPNLTGSIDTRNQDAPSRPAGVQLESGAGGELYLRRSWFQPTLFFLLFFCIAWDSFLIFWYSMAIRDAVPGGFDIIMFVFPVCHVAVGVGLTYFVVAGFLNKTEILVTGDSLYVRHGPIPWRGQREVLRSDIRQVESETVLAQGTDVVGAGLGASGLLQLSVSVQHIDGGQVILLKAVPPRQAEFMAWQLADYLGVPLVSNQASSATGFGSYARGLGRLFSRR